MGLNPTRLVARKHWTLEPKPPASQRDRQALGETKPSNTSVLDAQPLEPREKQKLAEASAQRAAVPGVANEHIDRHCLGS